MQADHSSCDSSTPWSAHTSHQDLNPGTSVSRMRPSKSNTTARIPDLALLDLDAAAGPLKGGPSLLGVVLADPLEDRLGGAVDQVLGLLQAEAGQRAHLLDDLDLLVAGSGEDDVELVLLLLGGGRLTASTGGRG